MILIAVQTSPTFFSGTPPSGPDSLEIPVPYSTTIIGAVAFHRRQGGAVSPDRQCGVQHTIPPAMAPDQLMATS